MSVIANRVKVAVDGTPGTGTIDLGAAVTGFQSFADGGITNGQVVSYAIEDGDAWEIGTGTYTTGTPNTLSRTVIESSNSDAAINLSGSAVVFITALASELQYAVRMDQGVATTDSPSFVAVEAANTASAWVNFNGTGTIAERDSFNVTSLTDNGTGSYAVNFTAAMSSTSYAVFPSGAILAGSDSSGFICGESLSTLTSFARTASSIPFLTLNQSVLLTDTFSANLAVSGDLA